MKIIRNEARLKEMKGENGEAVHCVELSDRTAIICVSYQSALNIMISINGGSREMLSMVY
jgi:hypothetical protein